VLPPYPTDLGRAGCQVRGLELPTPSKSVHSLAALDSKHARSSHHTVERTRSGGTELLGDGGRSHSHHSRHGGGDGSKHGGGGGGKHGGGGGDGHGKRHHWWRRVLRLARKPADAAESAAAAGTAAAGTAAAAGEAAADAAFDTVRATINSAGGNEALRMAARGWFSTPFSRASLCQQACCGRQRNGW